MVAALRIIHEKVSGYKGYQPAGNYPEGQMKKVEFA
jgi:hypothetical protein